MTKLPSKLLWIDLEMTGLRPLVDKITEIGVIITDFDFKEIATYESSVKHPEKVLKELTDESPWHTSQPDYTAKIIFDSQTGKSESVVQSELIALIEKHIGLSKLPKEYPFYPGSLEAKGEVYLAGNSIATDRAFIDSQWHELARVLHYRMLDVSSFKLYMLAKKKSYYAKKNAHRALDDIRESIEELRYYVADLKSGA